MVVVTARKTQVRERTHAPLVLSLQPRRVLVARTLGEEKTAPPVVEHLCEGTRGSPPPHVKPRQESASAPHWYCGSEPPGSISKQVALCFPLLCLLLLWCVLRLCSPGPRRQPLEKRREGGAQQRRQRRAAEEERESRWRKGRSKEEQTPNRPPVNLCCLCVRSRTPFFVEKRGRGGGHREARRNLSVLRSDLRREI